MFHYKQPLLLKKKSRSSDPFFLTHPTSYYGHNDFLLFSGFVLLLFIVDDSREKNDTPGKRPRRIVPPSRIFTDPNFTLPSYLPKTRTKRRRPKGDVKTKELGTVKSTGIEKYAEDVDAVHTQGSIYKEGREDQEKTSRKRKRGHTKTDTMDSPSFQQMFEGFVHENQATENNEKDQERPSKFWRYIRGGQATPSTDDFHNVIEGETLHGITIFKSEIEETEHDISHIKRRGIKMNPVDYSSDESMDSDSQIKNDNDGTDCNSQVGNIKLNRNEKDADNSEGDGGSYLCSMVGESEASIKLHVVDDNNPEKKMATREKDDVGKSVDDGGSYGCMKKNTEAGDNGEPNIIMVMGSQPIGNEKATIEKDGDGNTDDDGDKRGSMNKETEAGDNSEPNIIMVMDSQYIGNERATVEKEGVGNSDDEGGKYVSMNKKAEAGDNSEPDIIMVMDSQHVGNERATVEKEDFGNSDDEGGKYVSMNKKAEAGDNSEPDIIMVMDSQHVGNERATVEKEDVGNSDDEGGKYVSSDDEGGKYASMNKKAEAGDNSEPDIIMVMDSQHVGNERTTVEKDDVGNSDDEGGKYGRMHRTTEASDVGEPDIIMVMDSQPIGKERATVEKEDVGNSDDDGGNYGRMNRTTEASNVGEPDVMNGKLLGKEGATGEKGDETEREIFYIKRRGMKGNQIDYSSDESVHNDSQERNDNDGIKYDSLVENMQLNRDDEEDAYNSKDNSGSYMEEESEASYVKLHVRDDKGFEKRKATRAKDDIGSSDDDGGNKKNEAGNVGELGAVDRKPYGKKRATREKDDIGNSWNE